MKTVFVDVFCPFMPPYLLSSGGGRGNKNLSLGETASTNREIFPLCGHGMCDGYASLSLVMDWMQWEDVVAEATFLVG